MRGDSVMPDSLMILIVEDDQAIQSLVEETLSDGGFDSSIRRRSGDAVAGKQTTLPSARDRYMDGWEVARQAREINPALPIVYMTGAAADDWASHGVPNSVLLTKPFAPAQLVQLLLSF